MLVRGFRTVQERKHEPARVLARVKRLGRVLPRFSQAVGGRGLPVKAGRRRCNRCSLTRARAEMATFSRKTYCFGTGSVELSRPEMCATGMRVLLLRPEACVLWRHKIGLWRIMEKYKRCPR